MNIAFTAADLSQLAAAVADELERRGIASRTAPSSPYLSATEAAQYLRCGKQRLYDLAASGALVPRKDGARSLYHVDDLDDYLATEVVS